MYGHFTYKSTWAEIAKLYRLTLGQSARSQLGRLNSGRKVTALRRALCERQVMSGSKIREQPDEFDMDLALHGEAHVGGPASIGLVDVLKRIPREHRKAVVDAAIQEIDAADRRASLEQALKDKVKAMSSDELERFINAA
jgi:hypothetical protein